MNVEVIDNFLDNDSFSKVQQFFCNDLIDWHYNTTVVSDTESDSIDNFQFIHIFYRDGLPSSNHYKEIIPLLTQLKARVLFSVKSNLNVRTPEIIKRNLHIDDQFFDADNKPISFKVGVYYLNDNDGYTYFEGGEKIETVANRMVIFPSNVLHAGTTCTNQKTRVVLNFNYLSYE